MFDLEAVIDKKSNDVLKDLQRMKKQIPFASAVAITRTLKLILEGEKKLMASSLSNPNAYTLNALRVVPATKATLEGSVVTKTPSSKKLNDTDKYLAPEALGGKRMDKRFEKALRMQGLMPKGMRAVPAKGVEMDQYGNIPRVLMNAMFKSIKGTLPTEQFARGVRGKYRAKGTPLPVQKPKYFVVMKATGKLLPGIWKRNRTSDKNSSTPILLYQADSTYTKKFDFFGLANTMAEKLFVATFEDELEKAIANAK